MGLTAAKTYYGPINLTIKDNPSTNFTRSGLKDDSLKFSIESKEGNQELEDGKEAFWLNGRKLKVEITFTEMDPTATTGDLAKIEDSGNDLVEIYVREKAKTISISSPDKIFTHIDENFRTRIVIYKTGDITGAVSDLMSIA